MSAALFRNTGQPVWRKSYDVNDPRAQVFRPIGDGTTPGALDFVESYLRGLSIYADERKQAGKAHDVTANLVRMIERMLRRCTDFATGRCEPSIDRIMEVTRFSRPTVVSLLRRAANLGLLDWVRRTEPTGKSSGEGPRVKQATNAYFFELSKMPAELRRYLRQKLGEAKTPEYPDRLGSGPVPPRWARGFAAFRDRCRVKGLNPARTGEVESRDARLAAAPYAEWPAIMHPNDPVARAAYAEELAEMGLLPRGSASSESAPESPP